MAANSGVIKVNKKTRQSVADVTPSSQITGFFILNFYYARYLLLAGEENVAVFL
jgi:hypothetical protein